MNGVIIPNRTMYTRNFNSVNFNSGGAVVTFPEANTESKVIVSRMNSGVSSIVLSAKCQTNGTVNLYAYNVSPAGNYTGTLANICVLVDNS